MCVYVYIVKHGLLLTPVSSILYYNSFDFSWSLKNYFLWSPITFESSHICKNMYYIFGPIFFWANDHLVRYRTTGCPS